MSRSCALGCVANGEESLLLLPLGKQSWQTVLLNLPKCSFLWRCEATQSPWWSFTLACLARAQQIFKIQIWSAQDEPWLGAPLHGASPRPGEKRGIIWSDADLGFLGTLLCCKICVCCCVRWGTGALWNKCCGMLTACVIVYPPHRSLTLLLPWNEKAHKRLMDMACAAAAAAGKRAVFTAHVMEI